MRQVRLRKVLLVVPALGLVFGGIVAMGSAREAARHTQCLNNLKYLGLGLHNCRDSTNMFPAGTVFNENLPPEERLSWFVGAWGWVGDGQVMLLMDREESWDSKENLFPKYRGTGRDDEVVISPIGDWENLRCPSNPARPDLKRRPGDTHYVGIAGLGKDAPSLPIDDPRAGIFGYDRRTRLEDVKDGASSTMMVAETAVENGPWTAGGPATVRGLDPTRRPYIGAGRQFGGTHPGVATVLFADGSVRSVKASIDSLVFEGLSTIAGGEALPAGWDR